MNTLVGVASIVLCFQAVAQEAKPVEQEWSVFRARVLDLLFPWGSRTGDETLLRVVVRFLPSFNPASQLVMTSTDQQTTIEYSKSAVLFEKAIAASVTEDAATTAKSIRLDRVNRSIEPKIARRWSDELWSALARSPSAVKKRVGLVQLDGTNYEIRISTSLAELSFSIQDEEVSDSKPTGKTQIVQWVNARRLEVESERAGVKVSPNQ
jgi:hypothetical protein